MYKIKDNSNINNGDNYEKDTCVIYIIIFIWV